jgi:hypothetical protein
MTSLELDLKNPHKKNFDYFVSLQPSYCILAPSLTSIFRSNGKAKHITMQPGKSLRLYRHTVVLES